MIKPWNPENSKCPNEHLRLTTMQMKIQPESAPGPLTKVLEHLKCNNFSFGRFLSALEKFGEKQTWISAQYKNNWISEFFPKSSAVQ